MAAALRSCCWVTRVYGGGGGGGGGGGEGGRRSQSRVVEEMFRFNGAAEERPYSDGTGDELPLCSLYCLGLRRG